MIFADRALLPDGWAEQVRITVAYGHITKVAKAAAPQPGDSRVSALLPALSNLHSHAFQRAMAGMTEHRIAGRDSFWTWRDLMSVSYTHLLVQPQAWLWAIWPSTRTRTGLSVQAQTSVPPVKSGEVAAMPLSSAGCNFGLVMWCLLPLPRIVRAGPVPVL